MKSHTKRALRAMPAAQVQISMPVQGVLHDVRHAFLGLCIDAGQRVLAAMMEDERVALCGAESGHVAVVVDHDPQMRKKKRATAIGGGSLSLRRLGHPGHGGCEYLLGEGLAQEVLRL